MLKADDLYQNLKTIEARIRENTAPDGTCSFDIEKVYIFLLTILSFLPESKDTPSGQSNS